MRIGAALLLLALALAACREAARDPPLEPVGAARIEAERAGCTRLGGTLQETPSGRLACVRSLPDAGKQCRAAGDCAGACLARSGTCAPFTPLFGCHEVLTPGGARITECLD
ncbi:MAG: hypothetical protein ACK4TB_17940 [Gemmobacter sp.]